jgi:hypothetical protein
MTKFDEYSFNGLNIELHGQWSSVASHPGLAMNLPASPNLRILGGGAAVETTGAGSLLTSSYPAIFGPSAGANSGVVNGSISGQEWEARAKDHVRASPARLFVCCFAAEIPDPTDNYTIAWQTSASANHPTAEAKLPPDFILVGGGARANWNIPPDPVGSLLYASRPGAGQSWYAAAKDHSIADPATITAFAIGLRRTFLDSLGLTVVRVRANPLAAVSRPLVGCGVDDVQQATLVSGGAQTHWKGAGSLLTTSCPDAVGGNPSPTHQYLWRAEGKDHLTSDPSTITSWGLALVRYH